MALRDAVAKHPLNAPKGFFLQSTTVRGVQKKNRNDDKKQKQKFEAKNERSHTQYELAHGKKKHDRAEYSGCDQRKRKMYDRCTRQA